MCRFLAYLTTQPTAPAELLADGALREFVSLSRDNKDGWGLAWHDEADTLRMAKAPEPADSSAEFDRRGVRANALCPGPIDTEHVRKNSPDEAARRSRLDRIPLGRFGEPEDVAGLALFVLSDAAAWITGQAILLDGGISCHYL